MLYSIMSLFFNFYDQYKKLKNLKKNKNIYLEKKYFDL